MSLASAGVSLDSKDSEGRTGYNYNMHCTSDVSLFLCHYLHIQRYMQRQNQSICEGGHGLLKHFVAASIYKAFFASCFFNFRVWAPLINFYNLFLCDKLRLILDYYYYFILFWYKRYTDTRLTTGGVGRETGFLWIEFGCGVPRLNLDYYNCQRNCYLLRIGGMP